MWLKYTDGNDAFFLNLDTICQFFRKGKDLHFEDARQPNTTTLVEFEDEDQAKEGLNRIGLCLAADAPLCGIQNMKPRD